jgi:MYXO-CTERM domain-containing protein
MKPNLLLLLALVLTTHLATGCSNDCEPGAVVDDDDDGYVDPFAGFQDIHLDADLIEVADVPFGDSRTIEVVLSNLGDAELVIEDFDWDSWSDDNWNLDPDTLPDELDPGDSATLEVIFVNTDPQDTYASLDILSNDPDEERISVGFIGRADQLRPAARLEPVVLDFGFVYTGGSVTRGVMVSNVGERTLEITGLTFDQSGTTFSLVTPEDQIIGMTLEPEDSSEILVRFEPTNLGTASAQLTLQTSDPQRPELTTQVRANGDGALGCTPPTISIDEPAAPVAIQFGQGQHLTATATVTDAEQDPGLLLVELFIGDQLIKDLFSGPGGVYEFDIDVDDFDIEDVLDEFPQGLHTFTMKVTDACPLSAEARFVGVVEVDGALDPTDGDGDGYSLTDGDCNDVEETVYPGALELPDGLDNDCDLVVDEMTAAWDDDCDGYCESPPCLGQGPAAHTADVCDGLADDAADLADCDDRVADMDSDDASDGAAFAPGLDEASNHLDDNCDGTIDEGTGFADDDGDGFNEVNGDCDDEDVEIFAGAIEWCDGKDNDCIGGVDDECQEEVRAVQVIGDVRTDKYQIPLGTQVTAEVISLSDDPALTWAWVTDKGSFEGATDGPTVVWRGPANTPGNEALIGTFANLQVTITDSQGRMANGFGVLLFAEGDTGPGISAIGQGNCGCAVARVPTGGPVIWSLLLLLAVLPGRTRRSRTDRKEDR